jgi:hypothetical protein
MKVVDVKVIGSDEDSTTHLVRFDGGEFEEVYVGRYKIAHCGSDRGKLAAKYVGGKIRTEGVTMVRGCTPSTASRRVLSGRCKILHRCLSIMEEVSVFREDEHVIEHLNAIREEIKKIEEIIE